jgi:hypothetical protein
MLRRCFAVQRSFPWSRNVTESQKDTAMTRYDYISGYPSDKFLRETRITRIEAQASEKSSTVE